MAKDPATFTAVNLKGKKPHEIHGVERISNHRLRREDWAVTKPAPSAGTKRGVAKKSTKRSTKTKAQNTLPRSVAAHMRQGLEHAECSYCRARTVSNAKAKRAKVLIVGLAGGEAGDSDNCGIACYRAFKRENFINDKKTIELRGPGPLGYGAFLAPGAEPIKKGAIFAEYVGELAPLGANTPYTYHVPKVCSIDSEKAGNWTRFINSHCKPNVSAWGAMIGKRHAIFLQAKKDILPGEELRSNYGTFYFSALQIKCKCDAMKGKHMPGDWRKAKK